MIHIYLSMSQLFLILYICLSMTNIEIDIIKLLITTKNKDIKDNDGKTPLMYARKKKLSKDIIHLLK